MVGGDVSTGVGGISVINGRRIGVTVGEGVTKIVGDGEGTQVCVIVGESVVDGVIEGVEFLLILVWKLCTRAEPKPAAMAIAMVAKNRDANCVRSDMRRYYTR